MNIQLLLNTGIVLKKIIPAIVLGMIFISLHACDQAPDTSGQHNATEEINEKDIEKYLDAILLASHNKDIDNHEYFYKLTDLLISRAISQKANELNLSEDEKENIIASYNNSKTTIINGIHNEIISKKDLNQQTDISYEYLNSVNGFSKAVADAGCKTKLAIDAILPQRKFIKAAVEAAQFALEMSRLTSKNSVVDEKCNEFLVKYIEPITDKLREEGIIKDTNIIISKMQDRIRASILKMASAQDTITFKMNNIEKRDYDLGIIEFSRIATMDTTIKATIIAGFDLSSYTMNINHNTRVLDIHLPQPIIIASNADVVFQEPSREYGSPEIDSGTYNKIQTKAKARAFTQAKKDRLLDEAKKNAYTSVINIFQPLMSLPQFNYKVNVYFDNALYLNGDVKEIPSEKTSNKIPVILKNLDNHSTNQPAVIENHPTN